MGYGMWKCFVLVSIGAALAQGSGPRCPPRAEPALCHYDDDNAVDDYFFIVKGKKLTVTYEARYLQLTCLEDVQLEDEALPRFDRPVSVPRVILKRCAPPPGGYAAALAALNVTARATLQLYETPASPALGARHFAGLRVAALVISGAAPLSPEPAFLEPLPALRDLRLTAVALPPAAASRLPPTLRSLSLTNVNLSTLPAETFARLPLLTQLMITDGNLRSLDLSEAPALGDAQLSTPLEGVALGPRLENLTMMHVTDATLRGNCSALRRLSVENATSLPARWLANCSVEAVRVGRTRGVGGAEFHGARSVRDLEVQRCGLRVLTAHWLADLTALRRLDLSFNELEDIPNEVVSGWTALRELTLSNNRLTRAGVAPLGALPALRELALDRNPIGDLCPAGDSFVPNAVSPFRSLRGLRSLRLSRVGLSRVCPDWRALRGLAGLDLRRNNVTVLDYEDLQWSRDQESEVDLRGNPVSSVQYSREQLRAVLDAAPSASLPLTRVRIDSELSCDCGVYWFAAALRARPLHGALRDALCAARRALRDVPLRELQCAVPQKLCPAGCSCRATGETSELHCARAGLAGLPRAPALPPPRALLLAGNNITSVAADDIPSTLEVVDLSDNLIASLEPDAAAALLSGNRSVLLRGNPLDCSCAAAPFVSALVTHARLLDYAQLRCAGGGAPAEGGAAACGGGALWGGALAAALVASAALTAACLARPVARQALKRFLFERGLCLRWILRPPDERGDEDRPYDAFVSFSHLDAKYAEELSERLERGPRRLRLCLHERDWRPGEYIPDQISHSVRHSKRTVVLLSQNFLESTWAQLELREAYAAALREQRPRLLLVLLPGLQPARAAAAHAHLRAYLAAVTYLQWDDVRFWDKIRLALPPPRPAPAAVVPSVPVLVAPPTGVGLVPAGPGSSPSLESQQNSSALLLSIPPPPPLPAPPPSA